eukprot:CAMPEP_0197527696 /NCGR_PEP_ID=MMETSP1318-20131121/22593_1 /TAXON_ID=552666 /ORGANISM="Partenskyella glossopodia, Strain RCC365" /LENGTH=265 /DNA_ID=CAMNT_0043082473 /DNA_START=75 /DNA_END=869 /DNA_ORIENTATION=+
MEALTIKEIEGIWNHSLGSVVTVRGNKASFSNGLEFELKEEGNSILMDGWKASLSKSTAEEIVWRKKGQFDLTWSFEGELLDLEGAGIESSNIVRGKRRRGMADYRKLNEEIKHEEMLAKRERERLAKEQQALDLIRQRKRRKQAEAEQAEQAEQAGEASSTAKTSTSAAEKPMKPITQEELLKLKEELLKLRENLQPGGKAVSQDKNAVLEALSKLESAKMDVEMLAKTLIAKALNPYRKHADFEIASRSKALFSKWKQIFKNS